MKHLLHIIVWAGISCLLVACSKSDDLLLTESDFGYFSLNVAVVEPNKQVLTKAETVDFNPFRVEITNMEGTSAFSYDGTFEQLKGQGTLRLAKGKYKVSVSQLGTMPETGNQPFYTGEKEFEVYGNSFTDGDDATVTCFMQQVRIKLVFTQEFISALKAIPHNVCLKNGSSILYTFTNLQQVGNSYVSEEVYIKPTDNLRFSFSAIEKEYDEPFDYNKELKNLGGKFPVANDDLTVTIGLAGSTMKTLSVCSVNLPYNIKMTVQ